MDLGGSSLSGNSTQLNKGTYLFHTVQMFICFTTEILVCLVIWIHSLPPGVKRHDMRALDDYAGRLLFAQSHGSPFFLWPWETSCVDPSMGASCPPPSGWNRPMGGSSCGLRQQEREVGVFIPLAVLLLGHEATVAHFLHERPQLLSDSLSWSPSYSPVWIPVSTTSSISSGL